MNSLPSQAEMIGAFLAQDASYEGIFWTGVRTTGIFCRPTCTARKPKPENVEFFTTVNDVLFAGYRPCLICKPLEAAGQPPTWILQLLIDVEEHPDQRFQSSELRARGIQPERVRRWFLKHHGMTFNAYVRARRMSGALQEIKNGEGVASSAYQAGYESLSGFNDACMKLLGHSPTGAKNLKIISLLRMNTPLGPMIAGATETALCFLEFSDRRAFEKQTQKLQKKFGAKFLPGTNKILKKTQQQLDEYFAGKRRAFDVPLMTPGSVFEQLVWTELQKIPFGSTRSYLEIAKAIGQPTAVRAVANANGYNRIAILIPCHRVIGSNGTLTGYGGGLWRKQRLLEMEKG